jgi:hypothetical protein
MVWMAHAKLWPDQWCKKNTCSKRGGAHMKEWAFKEAGDGARNPNNNPASTNNTLVS